VRLTSVAPSPVPTEKPIAEPTDKPIAAPTKNPIGTPTETPTLKPSVKPSASPVLQLTAKPTLAPTYKICGCGSFLSASGDTCTPCPANTYAPGTGALLESSCAPCPSDQVSAPGSCQCTSPPPTKVPTAAPTEKPCPCGHFNVDVHAIDPANFPYAAPSCALCPVGSYQPDTGAFGCFVCPVGFTSGLGACACVPQPTATPTTAVPSPKPSTPPTPVPTETPTDAPTRHPTAIPTALPSTLPTLQPTHADCPCGTFYDAAGSVCVPCAPNTFSAVVGAGTPATCTACPQGTYSNGGACSCLLSPTKAPSSNPPTVAPTKVPTALPTLSPTVPKSCPCGTLIIGESCVLCAAGTYSATANAKAPLYCITCPIGTSSEAGACSCTANPIALPTQSPTLHPSVLPTAKPSHGPCGCGTYLSGDSCVTCPYGSYFPGSGGNSVSVCATCPQGSWPAADSCSCSTTASPTLHPTALPTLAPTKAPLNSRSPTAFPTHPTTLPTLYPTTTLGCSEVPYGSCSYDSDGYYVSVVCSTTGVGGEVIWSGVDSAASTEDSTSEWSTLSKLIVAAVSFTLVIGFAYLCFSKKSGKDSKNYVKVSSHEEVPFATAPLKLGTRGHVADYHSNL